MDMKFSDLDKNFMVNKNVDSETVVFRNALEEPFDLYGVMHDGEGYCRMPREIVETVSENCTHLSRNPAGGRLRFKTNSPYIVVKAIMKKHEKRSHISLAASTGFDCYINGRFDGLFSPDPESAETSYLAVRKYDGFAEREVLFNLPPYNELDDLFIGLHKDATLSHGAKYTRTPLPVVFYGSSITQGGCASRPGMTYQNILSRMMDLDYINLGFAGSARGEENMAKYIAQLEMSAFVLDYDHNAPTVDWLRETHKRFFTIVREKHPDIPIIMLSRPTYYSTDDMLRRKDVILRTYNDAALGGDRNVYFIDGETLYDSSVKDDATVDTVHPTELGFTCMAKRIYPVLDEALRRAGY